MSSYTGVGSRETPSDVMKLMRSVAHYYAAKGWTLRSGGADGADTAFEEGWWDFRQTQDICYTAKDYECYIPWEGFNGHERSNHDGKNIVLTDLPNWREAERIAANIHPAWDRLTQGAKKLHTRSVYQVLGRNLDDPSEFLLCWAETDKSGIPKGGTRTAVVLAMEYGVECFNLFDEETLQRLTAWEARSPFIKVTPVG